MHAHIQSAMHKHKDKRHTHTKQGEFNLLIANERRGNPEILEDIANKNIQMNGCSLINCVEEVWKVKRVGKKRQRCS